MLDKALSAREAVGRLRDGMTIGIGGWGPRRKPMALVREILRSPLKDLTLVSYGGPDVGMLCAAGKVRKVLYGFVSLDVIPVEPWFRKAREAGAIEAREMDEGLLQWGLKAAGMRVPFLPTRVGLGTDVMTMNPEFRTVRSPYDDDEVLLAMPAIEARRGARARRPRRPARQHADARPRSIFRRALRARLEGCYVSANNSSIAWTFAPRGRAAQPVRALPS
jgi:glutaconate CoA-transferase subunit A